MSGDGVDAGAPEARDVKAWANGPGTGANNIIER